MRHVLGRLVFCQHRLELAPCAYKAIRVALPRAWKSLFTTSNKFPYLELHAVQFGRLDCKYSKQFRRISLLLAIITRVLVHQD
jgi:hypothetical protein